MNNQKSLESYADTELIVIGTFAVGLAEILERVEDEGSTVTLPNTGKTLSKTSDKIAYVIDELQYLKKKALDVELLFEVAKELED